MIYRHIHIDAMIYRRLHIDAMIYRHILADILNISDGQNCANPVGPKGWVGGWDQGEK